MASRRSFGLTSLHFFVFGLMMALGFGTVLAVPTATPPSGTVSPNFSSLNVSGATTSATTTVTGDLQGANGLFKATTAGNGRVYLAGNDTETTQVYPDGQIQTNTVNKPYSIWGSNATSAANNAGIKGTIGSVDGYLGFIDSAGSYGLYTPNNAKVLGTFTAAGAALLNGAISSATGALNLNDDTTVTGALTTTGAVNSGGALSVTGTSNLQGNVYDSGGALVLNDDVQVGVTSYVPVLGYAAKLFTGALSSLFYATHAEFGNFDIASTDDLFVDDKIFVGNELISGGDVTAGDDLISTDDVIAGNDVTVGDDIIVTDNISAGGNITATGGIGTFYQNYAYGSIGTGWHFINVGCETGDIMIACNGRVDQSGARFYGSKFSTYNSRIYCESYGGKDTATSTTSLYAYAYCFSPNGTPTTSTGNQGGTVDSVPLPD